MGSKVGGHFRVGIVIEDKLFSEEYERLAVSRSACRTIHIYEDALAE
jgi:hypothetical protein